MKKEIEIRVLRFIRRTKHLDFLEERAKTLAPFVCNNSIADPVLIAKQRMDANKVFSRAYWEKMQQQKTLV